jgi:hypothetical protein
LKGEIVVVIGGGTGAEPVDLDALTERARALVAEGLRPRDAAREAAGESASTNEIYARLMGPPR